MGNTEKSPFYGTFSYHNKRIKENGVLDRSYKSYEAQPQTCPDYNGRPLSVKQCTSAFIVMSAGLLICLVLLLLEILAPRKWIKWLITIRNRYFKKAHRQRLIPESRRKSEIAESRRESEIAEDHLIAEISNMIKRRRTNLNLNLNLRGGYL